MDAEQRKIVDRLYHLARDKEPGEISAFLTEVCKGDKDLRHQIELLLAQDDTVKNPSTAPQRQGAAGSATSSSVVEPNPGERFGPYRIVRKLGGGGMGVVFAAHDERLDRLVALKSLKSASLDTGAQKRLLREARVAASVNHPAICQLYDIGEANGQTYLVMELLEGESLAERIRRGPIDLPTVIQLTLGILTGLDVMHRKNLIHRDLKPSNIFLTPHGVKLLDFGLSRPLPFSGYNQSKGTEGPITEEGTLFGTPNYLAPEQVLGQEADARSDLFSVGAILYELLTGRQAFHSSTNIEILHAVLKEQPPVITGSVAIAAVDLIVRRALTKNPEERYQKAQTMSDDLRAVLLREDTVAPAQPRVITRLIVLPFRMLRPDTEIDFLAASLPDAITNSLSGLTSLIVRSSITASKYADASPDLKMIAAEAEVDVVLTGTLLRSGDRLRMTAQLAEAPGGTVIWSQTSQLSLTDIFQLQDDLVQRIVESLALPITERESRQLKHDVPANATAYEYYLRATQLSNDWDQMPTSRDLYLKCLEHDSRYAPAWARLGRSYNLLAKYGGEEEDFARAEEAFQRALRLNPDLTVAHELYAQLEVVLGRAPQAMTRLLERTRTNPNDPNLFSGLVYVCRACGLLDASIAAHHQARRLDPHVPTSVVHSYFFAGDHARVLESSGGALVEVYSLALLGREEEALEWFFQGQRQDQRRQLPHWYSVCMRALLEGKHRESFEAAERAISLIHWGGEELFYLVRHMAHLGETERALNELERAVRLGFICQTALAKDPWLDPLRSDHRFIEILRQVQARAEAARRMFIDAGGRQVLGTA